MIARQNTFPLSMQPLRGIDAYWRAANDLSVCKIYLFDSPLLKEPLRWESAPAKTTTTARRGDGPASGGQR